MLNGPKAKTEEALQPPVVVATEAGMSPSLDLQLESTTPRRVDDLLAYTEQPPTEPGFYWRRDHQGERVFHVQSYHLDRPILTWQERRQDGIEAFADDPAKQAAIMALPDATWKIEWAGPLTSPGTAQGPTTSPVGSNLGNLLEELETLDTLYERYAQGDTSVPFANLRYSLDATMAAYRAIGCPGEVKSASGVSTLEQLRRDKAGLRDSLDWTTMTLAEMVPFLKKLTVSDTEFKAEAEHLLYAAETILKTDTGGNRRKS